MKNIILFGSSGHLGFNLAKKLIENKYNVICIIRKENLYTHILSNIGCNIHKIDFRELEKINKYHKNYIIINTASKNKQETYSKNKNINEDLILLQQILSFSNNNNINKIINIGSSVIYSRSSTRKLINEKTKINFFENNYTKNKIECDHFLTEYKKINPHKVIIKINPGWIIGPDDKFLTPPTKFFLNYISNKKIVFYPNGGVSINNIENICKGIINSINLNQSTEMLFGGQNLSYKEIIKTYKILSNKKFILLYMPNFILKILSFCISSLNLKILNSFKNDLLSNMNALTKYSLIDSKKAKDTVEYQIANKESIFKNVTISIKKYTYNLNLVGSGYYFPNIDNKHFKNQKKCKLLITGFPGVLGNRFIEYIINFNSKNNNTIFCNLLVEKKYFDLIKLPKEFQIFYGNLEDKEVLNKSLNGIDYVYHLAGSIYQKSNKSILRNNYIGTRNLVDSSIQFKIKKFIFMSTDSVTGFEKEKILMNINSYKPIGAYGRSKMLAEKYIINKLNQNNISYNILRGFWFFDTIFSIRNKKIINEIIKGKQYLFGDGSNLRNISFTENIVINFFKCINYSSTDNKIYWLGEKNDFKMSDIYKYICSKKNAEYSPIFLPRFLLFFIRIIYKLIDFTGFNIPLLFSIIKLDMNISGDSNQIYKDTNYLKVKSLD